MRLIDADALGIGRCSKDLLPAAYCAGWNGVINLIEDAPTIDAVPVVRCKDCKHLMFSDFYGECGAGHYGVVRPDHFCSYGERKSSLLNKGGTEE